MHREYPDAPCPIYSFRFAEDLTFGLPPEEWALDAMLRLLETEAPGAPWMAASMGGNMIRLIAATVARGGHVRTGLEDAPFGPATWPRVVLILLAICAAIDAVKSSADKEVSPLKDVTEPLNWNRVAGFTACLGGYVAGMMVVGFPLATFAFCWAMLAFHRILYWKVCLSVSAGVTVVAVLLFLRVLYLSLPRGMWINGTKDSVTVVSHEDNKSLVLWGQGKDGDSEVINDSWGISGSTDDFIQAILGNMDHQVRLALDISTLRVGQTADESAKQQQKIRVTYYE